jgi:hypothetical protein
MTFRFLEFSSCLAFIAILGLVACGDDSDDNGTGFTSANVEEGTSTTDEAGTTIMGDGDGDTGDGDGDTTGDGDGDGDTTGDGDGDTTGDGDGDTTGDGDGDGEPGDGDGDTTGDGDGDTTGDGDGDPNACPPAPGDDACVLCVKSSCCAEALECEADADCVCMRDCIDGGGNNNQCKNMCGIQGSNQIYQQFSGCVGEFCPVDCG